MVVFEGLPVVPEADASVEEPGDMVLKLNLKRDDLEGVDGAGMKSLLPRVWAKVGETH